VAVICHDIQQWVEQHIEKPIDQWENKQAKRCKQQSCWWWCLCCNKWFCWLVWIIVKVVTWVLVTVGKWIARAVCEIVNAVLDAIAYIFNLILSIPVIGAIIRAVLNWVTEIIWRAVGLIDLLAGAVGIRPEKRIYVGVVIPSQDGRPITTEAAILPQIQKAQELYKKLCNVKIVYSGACVADESAPDGALTVGCNASGFFSDFWVGGSYIEFATANCKFQDGWRRVVGLGAQIVVFYVRNVLPDNPPNFTIGCSFASTHNYVVVEPPANLSTAAHEIGHACWLPHVSDPKNLMWPSSLAAEPTLTTGQILLIRWSKHCVYL
jgi:hypothetical protein